MKKSRNTFYLIMSTVHMIVFLWGYRCVDAFPENIKQPAQKSLKQELLTEEESVKDFDISPDGRSVAFFTIHSKDHLNTNSKHTWKNPSSSVTLYIRNIANNKTVRVFTYVNADPYSTLKYSADGKYLAFINDSVGIKIWDVRSNKLVNTLKLPVSDMKIMTYGNTLSFSRNGDTLYYHRKNRISIWNMRDGSKQKDILIPSKKFRSSILFHDGKYIILGGDKIVLWKIDGTNMSQLYTVHNYIKDWSDPKYIRKTRWLNIGVLHLLCVQLCISNNGQYLVAKSTMFDTHIWDIKAKKHITMIDGSVGKMTTSAFSPNSKYLAMGVTEITPPEGTEDEEGPSWRYEGSIEIWDMQKRKLVGRVNGIPSPDKIQFSPNGKKIVSTGIGKDVKIWNLSEIIKNYNTK